MTVIQALIGGTSHGGGRRRIQYKDICEEYKTSGSNFHVLRALCLINTLLRNESGFLCRLNPDFTPERTPLGDSNQGWEGPSDTPFYMNKIITQFKPCKGRQSRTGIQWHDPPLIFFVFYQKLFPVVSGLSGLGLRPQTLIMQLSPNTLHARRLKKIVTNM